MKTKIIITNLIFHLSSLVSFSQKTYQKVTQNNGVDFDDI